MDQGRSWVVLVGVFTTSILAFGYVQCVGVFFVDWQEELQVSAQAVGWCSSVVIAGFGCAGLLSSISSSYVSCRWLTISGGIIACSSLSCSNLITSILHLYILLAFTGLGTGLAFAGSLLVIGFYFDKKIALATGLGLSGSGLGMFLAPVIRYLNDEYSWRNALTLCGALLANTCVCGALFRPTKAERNSMKDVPSEGTELPMKSIDNVCEEDEPKANTDTNGDVISNGYTSLRTQQKIRTRSSLTESVSGNSVGCLQTYKSIFTIRFIMICIVASILTGAAYFTSLMYIVSNAINLGVAKTDAAFLLTIFGISGTIGRLGYGPLIDKNIISPIRLGSGLICIAGLSCLFGPFAKSYPALVVFSISLGFSASIFNALYPIIMREIVGAHRLKKAFGIGMIVWNIGGLAGVPLMGYVFDITGKYSYAFYFAGCIMILNSILHLLDPIWKAMDRRRLLTRRSRLDEDTTSDINECQG